MHGHASAAFMHLHGGIALLVLVRLVLFKFVYMCVWDVCCQNTRLFTVLLLPQNSSLPFAL